MYKRTYADIAFVWSLWIEQWLQFCPWSAQTRARPSTSNSSQADGALVRKELGDEHAEQFSVWFECLKYLPSDTPWDDFRCRNVIA